MSPNIKKTGKKSLKQQAFASLYAEGRVTADEIDDFVDMWHEGGTGMPLHDFLGLSREEYARWVAEPDALESALHKREHEVRLKAHDRGDVKRAAVLLKHVNDPTRLRVILMLAEGEKHVGALRTELQQSQPAISHHVALLRHGGIITSQRRGRYQYYVLTKMGKELVKVVNSLRGPIFLRQKPGS
jgi:DNA-binding transcriptional ArsR family regulator